jgi:hypothetical protein
MMDSQERLVANDSLACHRKFVSISFIGDVPHAPAAVVGNEHAAVLSNGHTDRTTPNRISLLPYPSATANFFVMRRQPVPGLLSISVQSIVSSNSDPSAKV